MLGRLSVFAAVSWIFVFVLGVTMPAWAGPPASGAPKSTKAPGKTKPSGEDPPSGGSAPTKKEAAPTDKASQTSPAGASPTSAPTDPKPAPAPASSGGSGAAQAGSAAAPVDAPGQEGTVRHSALYGDRLDGLQAEVDDLKDQIFRSKARLALLRETVLRGVLAGSRIILVHRNRMGSSFRLIRIVYLLDGAQVFARTDEGGGLDQEDELVVFDGNLPPGPHTVTIELTYKGHGYGVFSYLNGYTFDSRSTHSFTAPENGAAKLASTGFERGNLTTEMKDRPSIDWQLTPLDAMGKPLPRAAKRRK